MKTKNKGRIDKNQQWPQIKKRWLDAYNNKKNISGLSVNHPVKYND